MRQNPRRCDESDKSATLDYPKLEYASSVWNPYYFTKRHLELRIQQDGLSLITTGRTCMHAVCMFNVAS